MSTHACDSTGVYDGRRQCPLVTDASECPYLVVRSGVRDATGGVRMQLPSPSSGMPDRHR